MADDASTLFYRCKQGVTAGILSLNLVASDPRFTIADKVVNLMWPDLSAIPGDPCVIVTHVLGSESYDGGTTMQGYWTFPCRVFIRDTETVRYHEAEPHYLLYRKAITDFFHLQRPKVVRDNVPELNWCQVRQEQIIDVPRQEFQGVVSRLIVDVHVRLTRTIQA